MIARLALLLCIASVGLAVADEPISREYTNANLRQFHGQHPSREITDLTKAVKYYRYFRRFNRYQVNGVNWQIQHLNQRHYKQLQQVDSVAAFDSRLPAIATDYAEMAEWLAEQHEQWMKEAVRYAGAVFLRFTGDVQLQTALTEQVELVAREFRQQLYPKYVQSFNSEVARFRGLLQAGGKPTANWSEDVQEALFEVYRGVLYAHQDANNRAEVKVNALLKRFNVEIPEW